MSVEWSKTARADLARIFEFNLGWSERWAQRVDRRLLERGESLARTPFIGRPTAIVGLRQLPVIDVQYVLTYEVDGRHVKILRIHSTREIRDA